MHIGSALNSEKKYFPKLPLGPAKNPNTNEPHIVSKMGQEMSSNITRGSFSSSNRLETRPLPSDDGSFFHDNRPSTPPAIRDGNGMMWCGYRYMSEDRRKACPDLDRTFKEHSGDNYFSAPSASKVMHKQTHLNKRRLPRPKIGTGLAETVAVQADTGSGWKTYHVRNDGKPKEVSQVFKETIRQNLVLDTHTHLDLRKIDITYERRAGSLFRPSPDDRKAHLIKTETQKAFHERAIDPNFRFSDIEDLSAKVLEDIWNHLGPDEQRKYRNPAKPLISSIQVPMPFVFDNQSRSFTDDRSDASSDTSSVCSISTIFSEAEDDYETNYKPDENCKKDESLPRVYVDFNEHGHFWTVRPLPECYRNTVVPPDSFSGAPSDPDAPKFSHPLPRDLSFPAGPFGPKPRSEYLYPDGIDAPRFAWRYKE